MTELQKLTTNPLTSHTEGINLQLKDVYVPLGLVERKKQPKRQNDVEPERGSELYQETEITTKFEHNEFLAEVIKQKQTPKSKGQRIAIIGEPGAGKTTLLQQIADWVDPEVEQSLVIWVSLADLREQELRSYLLETWLKQVAETQNQGQAWKELENNFISQFNQGRVCLLLDGLDEMSVSEGNPLTEIDRQIKNCDFIKQAQIVLTCRVNLWDGSSNVLDNFDIYRTLDFSYPEQVEIFIDRWFTATENKERGQGKIDPGNPQAIAALVKLLNSTTVDDGTRRLATDSLGKIDPGTPQAIAALVNLLNSTTVDDDTRRRAVESLEKIDPGNPQVIAALVNLLNSTTVDDDTRGLAAKSLGEIGSFYEVVKALSGSWLLSHEGYYLIWKCAQNLPYPKFYQAWHESHFINRATKNLMRFFRRVTNF